jgi:hypothetical protein
MEEAAFIPMAKAQGLSACFFRNKSNHYSEMRDGLNIMPTSLILKTNKNQSVFFKLIKTKSMH